MCISRLTRICRYDLLFDVLALIRDKYSISTKTQIIGYGAELAFLKSKASVLGLEVNFVGELYDEEQIASYIYHANVTLSPGKVGLTAIHSMMYGTSVISYEDFESQMPEVESIVPGYTGCLFKKDSINEFADKLRNFKDSFPDRELTRRHCFAMIDKVYNPAKQLEILTMAINRSPAPPENEAFNLFGEESRV